MHLQGQGSRVRGDVLLYVPARDAGMFGVGVGSVACGSETSQAICVYLMRHWCVMFQAREDQRGIERNGDRKRGLTLITRSHSLKSISNGEEVGLRPQGRAQNILNPLTFFLLLKGWIRNTSVV